MVALDDRVVALIIRRYDRYDTNLLKRLFADLIKLSGHVVDPSVENGMGVCSGMRSPLLMSRYIVGVQVVILRL